MQKDAFKEKATERLMPYGDPPVEEQPVLLQASGQRTDITNNALMAGTSQHNMFENDLSVSFKENASFRADFGEHYFKVFPRWNESLPRSWRIMRVVGDPFHNPRCLVANGSLSANFGAMQENVYPFLWRVLLLDEYPYFVMRRQSSFHQVKDFISLNFHSTPQHAMYFRAYIGARRDISMAANEGKDPSSY